MKATGIARRINDSGRKAFSPEVSYWYTKGVAAHLIHTISPAMN